MPGKDMTGPFLQGGNHASTAYLGQASTMYLTLPVLFNKTASQFTISFMLICSSLNVWNVIILSGTASGVLLILSLSLSLSLYIYIYVATRIIGVSFINFVLLSHTGDLNQNPYECRELYLAYVSEEKEKAEREGMETYGNSSTSPFFTTTSQQLDTNSKDIDFPFYQGTCLTESVVG